MVTFPDHDFLGYCEPIQSVTQYLQRGFLISHQHNFSASFFLALKTMRILIDIFAYASSFSEHYADIFANATIAESAEFANFPHMRIF